MSLESERLYITVSDIVGNSVEKLKKEKTRIKGDKRLSNQDKDFLLSKADEAINDFKKIKCELWGK